MICSYIRRFLYGNKIVFHQQLSTCHFCMYFSGLNRGSTVYSNCNSYIFNFRKHNKITGFALKQLEKRFPKGVKGLKNFYNWTTNPEEEFNLLAKIMKSL